MIYIKFINYIVNFITIQPEPTTAKNQGIEGNNKPSGLKNFPYHQQGINKVCASSNELTLCILMDSSFLFDTINLG